MRVIIEEEDDGSAAKNCFIFHLFLFGARGKEKSVEQQKPLDVIDIRTFPVVWMCQR